MSMIRALSSPASGDSEEASRIVARKLFEKIRARVLAALDGNATSAAARVQALDIDAGHCWRAGLGAAGAACDAGNPGLAALQLAIMGAGDMAPLDAAIAEPGHLFIDGSIVPVVGKVRVRIEDDHLILDRDGEALRFRTIGGRWVAEAASTVGVWRVHGLKAAHPRYVVESTIANPAAVFPVMGANNFRKGGKPADTALVNRSIDAMEATLGHIGSSSPLYRAWLGGSIDGVVLTVGGASSSMTSPMFPGLVALNMGYDILDYAEVLTSAASQQRLHQLSLVVALTEPGKEEIRYLPTRRTYATSRRALTAAHDHVNAIGMLRDLRAVEDLSDQVDRRIAARRLLLATDCLPILERSDILTPAGRELWGCLRELA